MNICLRFEWGFYNYLKCRYLIFLQTLYIQDSQQRLPRLSGRVRACVNAALRALQIQECVQESRDFEDDSRRVQAMRSTGCYRISAAEQLQFELGEGERKQRAGQD